MKKYLLIFCVLCLIVEGVVFGQIQKTAKNATRTRHSSHLFDPVFFSQADEEGQQYKKTVNGEVLGGIVPHHLTAAPLIAGFFAGIANQKITTVILLSPNHYGLGTPNITTSKGLWTTIFGELDTETSKIAQLENSKTASVSEALFDMEHGVYALASFIKKTFPEAKMVPLVIKGGTQKRNVTN